MPPYQRLAVIGTVLGGVTLVALAQEATTSSPTPRIHSVTDISHEFTFYFDGRFATNYIGDSGRDARNWATLHTCDLSNVNLLILQAGASPTAPAQEDEKHTDGCGGDRAECRQGEHSHLPSAGA